MAELHTERLLLRQWHSSDRGPFAALNADTCVMRYFPAPLTREQSDALAARAEASIAERGWGLWAAQLLTTGDFVGFIGLAEIPFDAAFTPAVEVGWRLAREHWGHGYATEGARAATAFAFDQLGLDEVVSMTSATNTRSRAVMERLGMQRSPTDDFDHPRLAHGDPLRRHVLYRLAAPAPA